MYEISSVFHNPCRLLRLSGFGGSARCLARSQVVFYVDSLLRHLIFSRRDLVLALNLVRAVGYWRGNRRLSVHLYHRAARALHSTYYQVRELHDIDKRVI